MSDEHLERLEAMAEDKGDTWDHSDNDIAAIRWAIGEINAKHKRALEAEARVVELQDAERLAFLKWRDQKTGLGGAMSRLWELADFAPKDEA